MTNFIAPIEGTSPLLELAAQSEDPQHVTFAKAWIAGYRSPRTRDSYTIGIRMWFDWCAVNRSDPLRVARAHVDLWLRQLEAAGKAARTINLRLTTLSSFYAYLIDQDVLAKSPTKGIKHLPIDKRSPTAYLKRPQLADFVLAARDLGPCPWALVCLLAFNGLRISEACGIDVRDRSARDFYVQIEVLRKGGERQRITLAPPTAAAVEEAIGGRTEGPLLLTTKGTRMNQRAAQRILDKCAPAVRGEHGRITPHALRHSWATVALQSGANPEQVRHDGGWADMTMVSYYSHGQDDPARSVTHAVAGVVLSS